MIRATRFNGSGIIEPPFSSPVPFGARSFIMQPGAGVRPGGLGAGEEEFLGSSLEIWRKAFMVLEY